MHVVPSAALTHTSFTSTHPFGIFSPCSLTLDFPLSNQQALSVFLIYLTSAVARAFLLKGLVQAVWSLKQTPRIGS
jgi:hypothetical protein